MNRFLALSMSILCALASMVGAEEKQGLYLILMAIYGSAYIIAAEVREGRR